MRMFILIIFLLLIIVLGACAHNQNIVEPQLITVKQVEYVIKIPPKELLEMPPAIKSLDVDSAKQSDIARWILLNEERIRNLENMILEIAVFFKLEQDKLNIKAKEENEKSLDKALKNQTDNLIISLDKPANK